MDNQDWIGEPNIEERQIGELSYLEMGGITYDGPAAGTFTALMSQAPGSAPSYRGKAERIQRLILIDQATLNDLTGDIFAYKNSHYVVSMNMAGNYRNIDITPIEQCKLNIGHNDTVRGITFTNKSFHPVNMNWEWSSEQSVLRPSIVFNEVTNGIGGETEQIPAETVDIPVVPPDTGFEIPDFVMPPFPDISFPAALSTKTYTWVINNPTVGGIAGPLIINQSLVTRFDAYVVDGTSVAFNIEDRIAIGAAGINIRSTDLTVSTAGGAALSFVNPNIAPFHWVWLDISAVTGVVTQFVITMTVIT